MFGQDHEGSGATDGSQFHQGGLLGFFPADAAAQDDVVEPSQGAASHAAAGDAGANPVQPVQGGLLGVFDASAAVPATDGPPAYGLAARQGATPSGQDYSRPVPSAHTGIFPALDAAAKAASSDVPKTSLNEFGAFLPRNKVTEMIDFGDGFGPQQVSRVTGYSYGGLSTSDKTDHVLLGHAPPAAAAWFHSHPHDAENPSYDEQNQQPSPQDWATAKSLMKADPSIETYILGPDGVLRRFWLPNQSGQRVK